MDCDVVFGVCSVSASAQNSQRVRSWNGWVILFYFLEQLFVFRPYLEVMTSTSGSQALPLQVCASKLFFFLNFWLFDRNFECGQSQALGFLSFRVLSFPPELFQEMPGTHSSSPAYLFILFSHWYFFCSIQDGYL